MQEGGIPTCRHPRTSAGGWLMETAGAGSCGHPQAWVVGGIRRRGWLMVPAGVGGGGYPQAWVVDCKQKKVPVHTVAVCRARMEASRN